METVGKSIPKIDGMAIATGKPSYTEDLAMANALVVKILRSPHAFARIRAIDTKKAERLNGVECILTHADIPAVRFTLAGQTYPEPSPYDRLILDPIVRYVGDEVAIIAARDEATALKAMKLIKVDYEVFEPVLDPETAIGHTSVIHPEEDLFCNFDIGTDAAQNIASSKYVEAGDVEAEFRHCDAIVEETYHVQAQAHCMMETYRAFNYLDHMGRLVVVSSTQIPFHVRRHLARVLQIPPTRIRVIKPRIGGGFGGKQTAAVEIFTAVVTMKTGKPALLIYDRRETFESTTSRHAMGLKVRIGADSTGTIRALDIQGLSDTGAYGEHASTVFGVVGEKTLPLYNKTQAVRFMGHVVYTNKTPGGAFRGYGATQGTFALESAVNRLAEKLGMDPSELRQKNLIKAGETSLVFAGKKLGSSTLDRCIERGKELIGWDDKYPRQDMGGGKMRGVGMAVTMQGSGIAGIDTASAEIRLNDDGYFTLLIGSTDMGTGSDTILAQMAAEVLGTPVDHIIVHAADTDVSPYDPGSYASSTTYVTGMAVVRAARQLRDHIVENGAKFLGVDREDVEFDGAVVRVDAGSTSLKQDYVYAHSGKSSFLIAQEEPESITLQKIAELTTTGTGKHQLTGAATYGSNVSPPPFVAGFAEVEVDTATGEVELLKFVAVVDCGTVINPNLARIQAEGGIVQGIGMALFEDVQYDSRGRHLTNSFMQYKIPSRKDIGDVVIDFVPSFEPTGPFGAKSVGEVVANTPAPAIAHAIRNAVGVEVRSLPITAEKLFMGMNGAQR